MLADFEFTMQAIIDAENCRDALEDIIDVANSLPTGYAGRDKCIADFALAHAHRALMGPVA